MDRRRRHSPWHEPDDRLIEAVDALAARFGSMGTGFGAVLVAWRETVGAELARVTAPTGLRDGELRVRCEDATWASELLHLGPDIIRRLRGHHLSPSVTHIRPYVGTVPATTPTTDEPPAPPPPLAPLPPRDATRIDALVATIADDALREHVRRAMHAAARRRGGHADGSR